MRIRQLADHVAQLKREIEQEEDAIRELNERFEKNIAFLQEETRKRDEEYRLLQEQREARHALDRSQFSIDNSPFAHQWNHLVSVIGERKLISFSKHTRNRGVELADLYNLSTDPNTEKNFLALAPKLSAKYLAHWARKLSKRSDENDQKYVPGIVFSVVPEQKLDVALRFGVVSAMQRVPEQPVFFQDDPNLSNLDPEGILYIIAHGRPGSFIGSSAVLAKLKDPITGLPANFRGRIRILACHSADKPDDGGPSIIEKFASELYRPGQPPIQISGFHSSFQPEMSMITPADPEAHIKRRYIREFYLGDRRPRLPELERALKLKNSDYGSLAYLSAVRKNFIAKGGFTLENVALVVEYKNAIHEIKRLLVDEGVMISKKDGKFKVESSRNPVMVPSLPKRTG
jgi:hypothetical protein